MELVIFNNVTVDGVIQAPMLPDEDTRGDFQHGGWAVPYNAMQSPEAIESVGSFGSLLMGRRTYENFSNYFPKHPENPFTEQLTNMQKYVASTTLQEPLPWENSTLLNGNVPEEVAAIKAKPGDNLVVWGSSELIQTLMKHNLIDRYILLVHPIVLGSGRRMFPDESEAAKLHLISARATNNGVAVLTYEPAK